MSSMTDTRGRVGLWSESDPSLEQSSENEIEILTSGSISSATQQFGFRWFVVPESSASYGVLGISQWKGLLQSSELQSDLIVGMARYGVIGGELATRNRQFGSWEIGVAQRLQALNRATIEEDGFEAVGVSTLQLAWNYAKWLFPKAVPIPSVVPNADRGVDFRWYLEGWDLQIAVDPEETTVWIRNRASNAIQCGRFSEYLDQVRDLLSQFADH